MSFLKKLFGLGSASGEGAAAPAGDPVEYKGFVIRPAPYKSEGQYQTAGLIEKEIAGVRQEHRFVRADRHASHEFGGRIFARQSAPNHRRAGRAAVSLMRVRVAPTAAVSQRGTADSTVRRSIMF